MNKSRHFVFIVLIIQAALFLMTIPARATTRYIAATAGAFSGGSACKGQTAITPATWNGLTPVAGDVSYICGTITSSLTFQGGGTSANPVSLVFDTGAKISVPTCGSSCINLGGNSYILVDGGTNGIIEATASGTGLGNSGDSVAIYARESNHSEIRNVTINNMYVHTSQSDENGNNYFGLWISGIGNLVHGLTVNNALCGVKVETGSSGNQYFNNIIHNVNWGIFESAANSPNAITNEQIYGNEIYDFAVWDTTTDANHHDGIFLSGSNATTDLTHVDIFNNYLHGTTSSATVCAPSPGNGSCMTAYIFINTDSYVRVFNNLLVMNSGDPGPNNGEVLLADDDHDSFINNTLIGGSNTANNSNCLVLGTGTNFTVENNAFSSCPNLIWENGGSASTLDYNVYQNSSGGPSLRKGDTYYTSLASWQSAVGGD